ncbi:MAG: glycosyltransferase [Bacteroidota bacterium]
MRVLQLIDSLDAGGAERMAVNLANLLSKDIEKSYLVATRKEGLLKQSIDDSVSYMFLGRKSTFDIQSLYRFYRFIKSENISIIHAHSSSFFMGAMAKLLRPKVRLIWHDHYGNSNLLEERPYKVLKVCSRLFDAVFCVNSNLIAWGKEKLGLKSISYLSNFVLPKRNYDKETILKGREGKRILCLANLRPQKDHFNLVDAFAAICEQFPEWTLHCVGKDFNDSYSRELKLYVENHSLNDNIYFYGSKSDTEYIISQSTIGILSSESEGLPLALIEYGFGALAAISTNVGDCTRVINDNTKGLLVAPKNAKALSDAMVHVMSDKKLRLELGTNLKAHVLSNFSKDAVRESLLLKYEEVQPK